MCSYCTKLFDEKDRGLCLGGDEFICADCILVEEAEDAGYYGEFV